MTAFSSTTVYAMDPEGRQGTCGPFTNFVFNFVEHEERTKTFLDQLKDMCRIHSYPPDQQPMYPDGNTMMIDVRAFKKVIDSITELALEGVQEDELARDVLRGYQNSVAEETLPLEELQSITFIQVETVGLNTAHKVQLSIETATDSTIESMLRSGVLPVLTKQLGVMAGFTTVAEDGLV